MHSIANQKNVSIGGSVLKQFRLEDVCTAQSSSNNLIKGKQIQEYKDWLYPAFSATGQDVWREKFEREGKAIIVSAVGARCGKCFRADGKWTAIANTHIIFPKKNINRDYFFYYINNENFWEKGGVAQPFVKIRDTLRRKSIPLPVDKNGKPDLAAQKRIVDILEGAEALKNKRLAADRKMSDLVPALFVETFGDKKSNWTRLKISEISKGSNAIRTGPFGSQLHHSEFVNTGIPVLGIDNVSSNKFQWGKQRCLPTENYLKFKKFRVYPGDVIVTIMGTVGRACVAPKNLTECMSTKHLCVITPDTAKVNPLFLWGTLLFDDSVRRQTKNVAKGAIMEGWNSTIIKNLYISIPPIALQTQFAEKIKDIESQKEKQKQSAAKLDELFHALLSRAFCGKTL